MSAATYSDVSPKLTENNAEIELDLDPSGAGRLKVAFWGTRFDTEGVADNHAQVDLSVPAVISTSLVNTAGAVGTGGPLTVSTPSALAAAAITEAQTATSTLSLGRLGDLTEGNATAQGVVQSVTPLLSALDSVLTKIDIFVKIGDEVANVCVRSFLSLSI